MFASSALVATQWASPAGLTRAHPARVRTERPRTSPREPAPLILSFRNNLMPTFARLTFAPHENARSFLCQQKFVGPHQNQAKTKELQDQGKKINLSLSEMAQFFMKMADAMKKRTLKPGGWHDWRWCDGSWRCMHCLQVQQPAHALY